MPTAFLDRDGVINRKPAAGDYVKSWQEFEFLPGVFDAIHLLKQHEFRVVVITNQRGVSLGKIVEEDLRMIHQRMTEVLRGAGASLDGVYYCPHNYNSCNCRKPAIGLFLQAQRDFPEIRFTESAMVGDSVADMQAGERLGCKKILIATDNAEVVAALKQENIEIDFSAPSLLDVTTRYLIAPAGRDCDGARAP